MNYVLLLLNAILATMISSGPCSPSKYVTELNPTVLAIGAVLIVYWITLVAGLLWSRWRRKRHYRNSGGF